MPTKRNVARKQVFRIRVPLRRIQIQHFRLNTRYRSGCRVLMTKNKNLQLKINKFFWDQNYKLPIPRLP